MLNIFPPIVFTEKIDIHRSHITYNPGLLFICGGECEDISKDPISVRDYAIRQITNEKILARLIQAEEMQSWLNSGAFEDLVLFEKALAHLADKIIIFVESPGSIAELGAFSFNEEISSKLLVFISSNYKESSSFITLGPIKKLLKNDGQSVKFYSWNEAGSTKIKSDLVKIPSLIDSIVSDIEGALGKQTVSRAFKEDNVEHRLLFICDILNLFPALQMNEILDICLMAEVDITLSDIKGYLYILTRTKLLKEVHHGETYYLIGDKYADSKFLKYAFKGEQKIHDRSRVKVEMLEYLNKSKDPKDRKRLKIIKGNPL